MIATPAMCIASRALLLPLMPLAACGSNSNIKCFSLAGGPDYCSPNVYRAQPSHLHHNNRDGTFTDVTGAAGMAAEFGPALGVVTADFNGDGWIERSQVVIDRYTTLKEGGAR